MVLAPAVIRAATPTNDDGIEIFRGIRYGTAERFQAPAAVPFSRGGPEFGPSSPQRGDRYRPVSEDCLYLNVWTPDASAGPRRPVLAYIHGGAYSTGSAVDPMLDGTRLAARGDAVVVTLQHRLNVFGYLSLARLDPRFADSGNAGQLDLILALRWVRDNIAAFGGDPGQVTLVGQSGGGAKIATLMGMPAARGLFHRAATMSGQQVTVSGPLHAEQRTRAFMDRLSVTSAEQLLALPVERLVEGLDAIDPILGGSVYFGPVLDMKWLDRHPFWPDSHPQSNAIPMLLGNTHDETRGFFGPNHPTIVGLAWDNLAARIAPELRVDADPDWVVREYRELFPTYSPDQIFFAATTASRSWRAQVIEAEARAAAGAPAFVYQLDFPSPAPHGADIPLLFSGEGPLAAAFVRFVRTGDPGWPAYALPERRTMVFGEAPRLENDPRGAERELFARIPYIQPGT